MPSTVGSPVPKQHHDLAEALTGIVVGLGLAFTLAAVLGVPFSGRSPATRDFVEYWASAHQLVRHANPYDPGTIGALELSAGSGTQIVMLNLPWTLPLIYPLGFFNLAWAALLWNLLLLAAVLISVRILRVLHGSPPNLIHWMSIGFTPLVLGLVMGQLSILVLLGSVLFMRFNRHRPIVAGAALWFCALKPHLFLPFAAALLAWIVATRSYKVVIGAAAALLVTTAAAYVIDPRAWPEYFQMTASAPAVRGAFVPSLSDALCTWIDPRAVWLRFLPAAVACVWAPFYYWNHRSSWQWYIDGSLLLLISLVVAPYGWLFDQCCALPAILHGAYTARSRGHITALAVLILLADLQFSAVHSFSPLSSYLWLWTGPAWLVWYLFARSPAVPEAIPVST